MWSLVRSFGSRRRCARDRGPQFIRSSVLGYRGIGRHSHVAVCVLMCSLMVLGILPRIVLSGRSMLFKWFIDFVVLWGSFERSWLWKGFRWEPTAW